MGLHGVLGEEQLAFDLAAGEALGDKGHDLGFPGREPGVGGHAVSKRSGTNGADYYLQGYAVADVFAAYKMKLQYPVTLQVNVKNLFDKTYYTSSIGTNNLGNQIGDPREVQFTVKMQ